VGSAVKRAGRSHRSQPEHDTNLVLLDFDPLHERANELTARLPIGILQPRAHLCGELFQPADEQADLAFDLGPLLESLRVHFQPTDAFAEASDTRLKLRLVN
jgi:hypothetical protein